MTSYTDESYALFPKSGSAFVFNEDSGISEGSEWKDVDGLTETPHGLVRCFSRYWGNSYSCTRLFMCKDGRSYIRSFKKAYSAKYMVTLAKQFAKDLYEGD